MYSDSLISITDNELIIKFYYFPFGISKKIKFDTIEKIQICEPSLLNGKFRIWGSSSLQTWYSLDLKRPIRDAIFIVNLKRSMFKSGFTVKSKAEVIQELLKNRIALEYK